MNTRQKIALAAGLALVVAVVLYPTWQSSRQILPISLGVLAEIGAVIVLTAGVILFLKSKPTGE